MPDRLWEYYCRGVLVKRPYIDGHKYYRCNGLPVVNICVGGTKNGTGGENSKEAKGEAGDMVEIRDLHGGVPEEMKSRIDDIDQWLEKPHYSRLSAVLRLETRRLKEEEIPDEGFKDKEEVERYVCMLAPALPEEPAAQPVKGPVDASLKDMLTGRLKKIKGGTFLMGDEDTGQFQATIKDFWMDMYPVTQALYRQVTGKNPSRFEGDDRPVESVSWFEAVDFCNRLSEKMGLEPVYKMDGEEVEWQKDKNGFRLPTEAEWEYACRAGTTGERYGPIDEIAWYNKNSGGSTQGVGQKKPNGFGLYDMLGNVWEWVWDWHGQYPSEPADNPSGPDTGSRRVRRGGSWIYGARFCRSAIRLRGVPGFRNYDLGVRLSCAR